MSKFVVVVFPDDESADQGVQLLKELHEQRSISLYNLATASTDLEGKLSIQQSVNYSSKGTAIGAMMGGLIGAIGGPAGVAIGAVGGAVLARSADLTHAGVAQDLVHEISEKLTPGKSAVIAEVADQWFEPLDAQMQEIGGTIVRA